MTAPPRGIAGLEGVEPVGAVLRVGRKDVRGSGKPVDTDRFFIASPNDTEVEVGSHRKKRKTVYRPLLPGFEKFNTAPPEQRKTIRGNLVHAVEAESWSWYRGSRELPGLGVRGMRGAMHPDKIHICSAGLEVEEDGGSKMIATRLVEIGADGAETWSRMDCENELCEFAQSGHCKPILRFYFRPNWTGTPFEGLPAPLMRFASQSWRTTKFFKGFYDYVRGALIEWGGGGRPGGGLADEPGRSPANFYGVPFVMTLTRKVIRRRGFVFPVSAIAPDGDLLEFVFARQGRLLEVGRPLPLLAGASTPIEVEPRTIATDIRELEPETEDAGDDPKPSRSKPRSASSGPIAAAQDFLFGDGEGVVDVPVEAEEVADAPAQLAIDDEAEDVVEPAVDQALEAAKRRTDPARKAGKAGTFAAALEAYAAAGEAGDDELFEWICETGCGRSVKAKGSELENWQHFTEGACEHCAGV